MKVTKDKIECSMEEWDCYSFHTPPHVVEDVNQNILSILSSTHSPVWAQKRIYDFLNQYKQYGFRDSECDQVSTDILNSYYNSNISRYDSYSELWK